jgi:anaerobic magnesium-protoporphyrin IX monomethyl ester cyclase
MKVLLIQPPVRVDQDPVDIPNGLGILASIAINENHQVALLDLNSKRPVPSWKSTAKQIAVEKWDVIGIGGLSSMYEDIKKLILICRKLNPSALIVCGGGFITYMPDKIMKFNPEIDIACIGEGEVTWKEILSEAKSKNWKSVKGICYRQDDEIIFTEPRPLIPNMDDIPYPAYDLMDLDSYFKYSGSMWYDGAYQSKRRINFVTERGCPRQCTFCTHNGMNRWDQEALLGEEKMNLLDSEAGFQPVMRFFSAEYITNQAKMLYEKYKVDYICLLDENLTASSRRVHDLCDSWIKEELNSKIKLGTSGDAPSITPQVVKHMKKAGFTFISIGGESGSDKILLEDIGKGVTVAHNQSAVDILKKEGIMPIMTFMVGNPNENIDDVLQTVEFFIKNNVTIDPFICTPYPGTKIFMDYQDFILQQYDERLKLLNDHPNPKISEELVKQWKDEALEKFLLSLNNATDYSCTVSQHFDFGDLLTIKYLMHKCDVEKLLKLAHLRNWEHDKKWNDQCSVCIAEKIISIQIENN